MIAAQNRMRERKGKTVRVLVFPPKPSIDAARPPIDRPPMTSRFGESAVRTCATTAAVVSMSRGIGSGRPDFLSL